MDTPIVDTSSTPTHDPATAPGRFVVRDAHHEDLPEAAAVQAVCFREIGQGVIPNDILTEVTGPGIVHTTIEQWNRFMDDGAIFKILIDRLDMKTVGVAMARVSTSPDAPTPWEIATPSMCCQRRAAAERQTTSLMLVSGTSQPMCGFLPITLALFRSTNATGFASTPPTAPLTIPSAG